jgi:nicotinate-nucleotide pyrophosphorylase (carboxylating)
MFIIDTEFLKIFIEKALAEDVGDGDHTSNACIPADATSKARLIMKDHGVVAGITFAKMVFDQVDPAMRIDIFRNDGDEAIYGDILFEVTCNTRALLKAERLILNTMQRMSGIATLSNQFKSEVEGLPVILLDTRKTTPLFRAIEKWAVKIGGCENYRFGLYDWIMIKDNHVDACGSHTQAIQKAHEYLKTNELDLNITVEVRNLNELNEVLVTGGVTRIMLDNFELPLLAEAVAIVNHRFETEASGGIHLKNVRKYAMTGVDFISVGALTHSAGTLDMSLKVVK